MLDEFVAARESVFGKGVLDITVKNFTCCGARHISLADASYSMDQEEYIAALKPIENASMTGRPNTQLADSENASLFLTVNRPRLYSTVAPRPVRIHSGPAAKCG